VVKIDADAVGPMLTGRGRYIGGMASFTLDGKTYEYLKPDSDHPPEACHSWTYGKYPTVLAALPLTDGGTVDVPCTPMRIAGNLPTSTVTDMNARHRPDVRLGIPQRDVRKAPAFMSGSGWLRY
jgi:hypothetical protein